MRQLDQAIAAPNLLASAWVVYRTTAGCWSKITSEAHSLELISASAFVTKTMAGLAFGIGSIRSTGGALAGWRLL